MHWWACGWKDIHTTSNLSLFYAPNWDDSIFFNNLFSVYQTHNLIMTADASSCSLHRIGAPKREHPRQNLPSLVIHYLKITVWLISGASATLALGFSPSSLGSIKHVHVFLDKRILQQITMCDYGSIVFSDHGPLSMELLIPSMHPIYCQWRLNLLLAEEECLKYISSEITFFLKVHQTAGMSPLTIWEALKVHL